MSETPKLAREAAQVIRDAVEGRQPTVTARLSQAAAIDRLLTELAEVRAAYDELVRLLKKRFPANPDGSLPDFKVEDVLAAELRKGKP